MSEPTPASDETGEAPVIGVQPVLRIQANYPIGFDSVAGHPDQVVVEVLPDPDGGLKLTAADLSVMARNAIESLFRYDPEAVVYARDVAAESGGPVSTEPAEFVSGSAPMPDAPYDLDALREHAENRSL